MCSRNLANFCDVLAYNYFALISNTSYIRIAIKYIMELETGIIKGNKTKYYNKTDDKEIIKYSKYVNLGVNSSFNIDDKVVVMAKQYYDDLMAVNDDDIKLNETIKELSNNNDELMELLEIKDNNIDELRDQLQQSTNTNANKSDEIINLTNSLAEVEQQLTEFKTILKQYDITTSDDLNNVFGEFRVILNYLNDCLIAYEKQGRIKRFLKENPTSDIVKPATKLLDYRGNQYINNGADISANKVDNSKE